MNYASRSHHILFIACLLTAVVCSKQVASSEEPDNRPLTIEEKKQLAEQLGLDVGANRFNAWLQNPAANYQTDTDGTPIIVKHLKGEYGVPLPNPDEIRQSYVSLTNPQLPTPDEQILKEQMDEEYMEHLRQLLTPIKFPRCTSSSRSELDTGYVLDKLGSEVEADFLFIAEEDLPPENNDYVELFGRKTQVRPISEWSLPAQFGAKSMGFDCLPARLRATKAKVFREQGEYALRNYDKDQFGKGELHISVEEVAKRYK